MYGLSPGIVAFVLFGNGIGGILFGWLFWRYSLEAAIIAHGLAHFLAVITLIILVSVGAGPA